MSKRQPQSNSPEELTFEMFTGENLCSDKQCPVYPAKHRHSTQGCMAHKFCAQEPLKPIDGTWKQLQERFPNTGQRDWDRQVRQRAYDENGNYIGFDQFLDQDGNNTYEFFGYEKEIPEGKKLIVTEEVMDNWIASHWGLNLENIPVAKPPKMDFYTHGKLRKQAQKAKQNQKDIEKAHKRVSGKLHVDEEEPKKANQVFSTGINFELSPKKFEPLYLPYDIRATSFACREKKTKRKLKPQQGNSDLGDSFIDSQFNKSQQVIIPKKMDIISENPYASEHSKFKMTAKSSIKIPDDKKYKIPPYTIRNRINSECLTFMNYQEIEKTAKAKAGQRLETHSTEKKNSEEKHVSIVHGIQNQMKMPPTFVKPPPPKMIIIEQNNLETKQTRQRSPIQCLAKPGSKMRQNLDNLLKMREVQTSLHFNNVSSLEKKPVIVPVQIHKNFTNFETTAKNKARYLKSSNNAFSKTFVAGLKMKKGRPKSSNPVSKTSKFVNISRKNIEPDFNTTASETVKIQNTNLDISYRQLKKDFKYSTQNRKYSRQSANIEDRSQAELLFSYSTKEASALNKTVSRQQPVSTTGESPRVLTQISGSNFQLLLSKSSVPKLAQTRMRSLKSTSHVSATNLHKCDPVRDSVSTNLRIKNERVTSKILLEQQNLQKILENQFSLNVSKVELPVYAQLEILKKGKEFPYDLQKPSVSTMNFSDQSIGKINEQSSEISMGSGVQKDFFKINKITFQNVKDNFGLSEGPNYYNVQQRGFKPLQHFESSKILFKEVKDSQTAEKEMEDDNSKDMNTEDMKAANSLRLKNIILQELDEIHKNKKANKEPKNTVYDSVNVDIKQFVLELTVSKVFKDFKDYRFWLQQAQIRRVNEDDWESPLDYLASGLREIPLNLQLIYNYACVNEKLGNYDIAIRFFGYACEIRPRWTDALFGMAVTYFKLGQFKKSKQCVKIAIHNYKNTCFEKLEVMQYFQAMCYKNLGKFKKAERDYGALSAIFKQNESEQILSHVIGCVLLPLQESRHKQHEFVENTVTLLKFFQPCEVQDEKDKISQFEHPETGEIQAEKYGLLIYELLKNKPFFKRFKKEYILKFMAEAKVEYFDKDDIIFLKGRVGVITHGSVRVISHQEGIMKPTTVGKYGPGRILGHGESDDGITINPQTWFNTFDDGTEIVFFEHKSFCKLWGLQSFEYSKIIISAFLQNNQVWKCLCEQTRLHLIFECSEVRKYRPGQMICRASKRSAINKDTYGNYYRDNSSSFKDQIDNAKIIQSINQDMQKQGLQMPVSGPGGAGSAETLVSTFVKTLTKPKNSKPPPMFSNITSPTGAKSGGIISPMNQMRTIDNNDHTDIKESKKTARQGFEETLRKLQFQYSDHAYPECDCLYFVYHGYVDVVHPTKREACYSIGMGDNFGESKILRRPGFEYMGDLYAGLYPKAFSLEFNKTVSDAKQMSTQKDNVSKQSVQINKSLILQVIQNMGMESKDEICNILIAIPLKSFWENVNAHEIKAIKENQEILKKKEGILNLVSLKYGFENMELFRY